MPKKNKHHIVFLRHAESVGNAEGYFQGQADFPLTKRGRRQARALAARWETEKRSFDYILASPLSRTRETAEIVAATLGMEIEYNPIWMERHNGEVSGLKHADVRETHTLPDFRNPYENFAETGEGDWALFLRAGEALKQLLERPPANYLVVSHGAFLNNMMKAILGVPPHANYQGPQFRFGNTSFATVTYFADNHRWYIEGLNDNHHLDNQS
jgi:broad specificity phosphatase PhoE